MTATRVDLGRPALARAAAARPLPTRPVPEESRRPDLRIVPVTRPRRGGALVVVGLLVVCGALLGTAVLHTMLVSGQRQVDRLDEQIRSTQHANQGRRLDVAELESPVRVVAEAEAAGMVAPDAVTWLIEGPDGRIVSSRTERPAGPDEVVTPPEEGSGVEAGSGVEETDANG